MKTEQVVIVQVVIDAFKNSIDHFLKNGYRVVEINSSTAATQNNPYRTLIAVMEKPIENE